MAGRRVVQWSTGGVGAIAVRVLAERPDLELAGVWVHDPKKVGRDAGEFAGLPPLGLAATSDRAALLALRPDCICYTASGESRPKECVEDLCEMLSAGVNVVTTSIPGLVHPPAFDPRAGERLEQACRAGGASLYASGLEPGFAGDALVLTLSSLSNRIASVRTQEIFSYADYPVAFTMFEVFGFGKPPEHCCAQSRKPRTLRGDRGLLQSNGTRTDRFPWQKLVRATILIHCPRGHRVYGPHTPVAFCAPPPDRRRCKMAR